jgi:DNA-binding CsgD family transcriptional regulator
MSNPDVLDAVDAIYAAALEPEQWSDALDQIARVVGGVGTLLLPVSPVSEFGVIHSPSLNESVRAYENGCWRYDCRNQKGQVRRVTSGVYTDSDVLDEDSIRRDPFYQEFLRPHGLGAFASHLFTAVPGHVLSLSVQRDIRRGPFEGDDLRTLSMLGGHVTRAVATAVKLAGVDRVNRALTSGFEQLRCGVILINENRTVILVNEAARSLFGGAINVSGGRLQASRSQDQKALDDLIGSCLPRSAVACPPVAISRQHQGCPPLLVQAVPVRADTADRVGQLALGSGVLLLLHELGETRTCVERQLVQMGLTRGQARVAEAIGGGLSPREAAAELGLTEGTVRSVLKTVYGRLDLSRQSQLAVLVTRLKVLTQQTSE